MDQGTSRLYTVCDLNENKEALLGFSECMDRQYKYINNWEQFALLLGVPQDEIRICKLYVEYSPTIKLFKYLEVTKPDMTVGDLRKALTGHLFKMDAVDKILIEADLAMECKVSDTITNSPNDILDRMAFKLDSGSSFQNWEELGGKLGLSYRVLGQFKMYHSYNPTEALFRFLYDNSEKSVKANVIVSYLEQMKWHRLLYEVKNVTQSIDMNDTDAQDVFKLESNLLDTTSRLLNDDSQGLEGWKGLAKRLISDGYIDAKYDIIPKLEPPSKGTVHSPTKKVIEWLTTNKPELTIDELIATCKEIGRSGDAVVYLTIYFPVEPNQQLTEEQDGTYVHRKKSAYKDKKRNRKVKEKQPSSGQKKDTDDADEYTMTSSPRGLMVIINIKKFNDPKYLGLSERKGSEKDVDGLTDLFNRYLNFMVCNIFDEPKKVIMERLDEISENCDYKDYDCLAVCIMSHGKEGVFYANDGKKINVSEVADIFSDEACGLFTGKPKLFFIEACSGQMGKGRLEVDGAPSGNEGTSPSQTQDQPAVSLDPDMSDMLYAYSCFDNYVSYRHPKEGSCFIQYLVSVFKNYADKEHVVEMLTRVTDKVHKHIHGTEGGRTQVPVVKVTLRKKLYFRPQETRNKQPSRSKRGCCVT